MRWRRAWREVVEAEAGLMDDWSRLLLELVVYGALYWRQGALSFLQVSICLPCLLLMG